MHKILSERLSFIAMVALYFFAPAAVGKDEWHLVQSTPDLGFHDVYVSSDGARIICRRWGYELLCKAPDWNVYCFRPEEKLFWKGPLKEFTSSIMTDPYALPKAKTGKVEPAGEMIMEGIKCRKYRDTKTPSFICGARDIPVAGEVSEFVSRYYFIPHIKELPVYNVAYRRPARLEKKDWLDRNITEDLRAGMQVTLATKSCRKQRELGSHFAVPKGYKQAADIKQVVYSKRTRNEMSNMLDSLGFTSGSGVHAGSNVQPDKPGH